MTRELATEVVEEAAEEMGIDAEEMGFDAVTEYACPCSEGVSSSILGVVLVDEALEDLDPHLLDAPSGPALPSRWLPPHGHVRGLPP